MSKRRREKYTPPQRQHYKAPLVAMNEHQAEYISALMTSAMTIVTGPAGTGKTFIASTIAADLLEAGEVRKIVLTRPNISASKSIGFFPGTLEEKIGPWVVPFTEAIGARLGRSVVDCALKNGKIEIVPFEVMRGRTFDDSFVILDEAQNTTPHEMKMFTTRIGKNTRVVVNGDIMQSDLQRGSGLHTAIRLAREWDLPVSLVNFFLDDIVRSDLCGMWVRAFAQDDVS